MNKRLLLVCALVLAATTAGCVDGNDETATGQNPYWNPDLPYGGALDDSHSGKPVGYLPATVSGMEHVANPVSNATYALWANDDLLYVASGAGLRVMDISEPTNPLVISEDIIDTFSRDVELMFHPNGRLYAVLADAREDGVRLVDVTDPTDPFFVSKSTKCTHNIAVVPDTTLVYSSFSLCHANDVAGGDAGRFAIVDFADPQNPVDHVIEFPATADTVGGVQRPVDATSCHHTTFTMERNLAYCAGITQTLVFDIADPLNPVIIQVIDWPGINIHHAVWPAHGGDMLILGDEMAGVAAPTPTCSENVDYPTSALWFMDTSDLSLVTPLGYFQADHYEAVNEDSVDPNVVIESATNYEPDPNNPAGATAPAFAALSLTGNLYCSTHFGSLVEDRDLFVLGWYTAGTVLVDFSDPTAPTQVDAWKGEGNIVTTDSTYYKGHVYSTDGVRGIDVLKII